jgi:hypothetical protein
MPYSAYKSGKEGAAHTRGNALFLILIAVALFAAVSYAVTQSGKGGGDTARERLELSTAQVMDHLSLVQAAVNRMLLSGITIDQITFCGPADTDGYCFYNGTGDSALCTAGTSCVFAPDGGGITPLTLAADIVQTGRPADRWEFYEIQGNQAIETMGTAAPDLVYRHTSINQAGCDLIHTKLGVPLPVLQDTPGGAKGGVYPKMEPLQCSQWFNGTAWFYSVLLSPAHQ